MEELGERGAGAGLTLALLPPPRAAADAVRG